MLLAESYSAWLAEGSVTLSAVPCSTIKDVSYSCSRAVTLEMKGDGDNASSDPDQSFKKQTYFQCEIVQLQRRHKSRPLEVAQRILQSLLEFLSPHL